VLYSGIAWTDAGFTVSTIDGAGSRERISKQFHAREAGEIISYLNGLQATYGQPPVTVIDSTNGMLDGGLMSAGLTVYRADPWLFADHAGFGSVDALSLAEKALNDRSDLALLKLETGTLTGRLEELDAGISEGATVEKELTKEGRCISHGSRDRPQIALTFDDGPHPTFTPRALDILERYGVTATFFCVGLHASGHPDLITRLSDAGHLLGNHTWSHAFLPDLSRQQISDQIARTAEHLLPIQETTRLFRPPYGSRSSTILTWLAEMDVTTVLWDVEPFDWALPGAGEIARRVLGETKPGSIILLHDGGGDRSQTVDALPQIIEELLDRGYDFVTVDQLATH
jgi:peptidoglycan/xylan/chitin deacetylase (PgdA/CDA1 family)